MLLPEGVGDVIYNRALRVLADRILPPVPEGADPPATPEEHALRPRQSEAST
jgi:hypothetical protein